MTSVPHPILSSDQRPMAQPPALVSHRIAAATSHPTRVHALGMMLNRAVSPREIAEHMDEPLNNVTYHVKQLVALGCAELIEAKPARGGRVVEHFYRATERCYFDDSSWSQLGEDEKQNVATTIMRLISDDINTAMVAGTFYHPDDHHVSRTPMNVDAAGWEEVKELLSGTLERLLAIRERAGERIAGGAEEIPSRVEIVHFRSPAPESPTASGPDY
jgi:hypothetical protein